MKITILDTECASLKGKVVQIANITTDEKLSEIKESRCTLVNPL